MNAGTWKRIGNGMVYVISEDAVSLIVVRQWKRLMQAHNDLAHVVNEHRRGADWATADVVSGHRAALVRAEDNWRSLCRAMGWKGANGRTLPVHLEPAPCH